MKICTWNVGGLKGGVKGAMPWLRQNQLDIVGLQETRTQDPQALVSALWTEGYYCKLHIEPDDKNWIPGVTILSKHPLEVIQIGLPGQERVCSDLVPNPTLRAFGRYLSPSVFAREKDMRPSGW